MDFNRVYKMIKVGFKTIRFNNCANMLKFVVIRFDNLWSIIDFWGLLCAIKCDNKYVMYISLCSFNLLLCTVLRFSA